MTKTIAVEDIGDALNKLFRDVQALQLRVSSPTHTIGSNPDFDSVTIGGVELIPTISPVLPAPGQTVGIPLKLTTGATTDDVYIDVEWTAPADGSASTYEVEIQKEVLPGVYGERSFMRTGSTTVRFPGLEALTKYAFRVVAINAIGVRSTPNPAVEQSIISAADTAIPPTPTGVIIARGATSAIVKFTPLTFAEAKDVAAGNGQYEVQIDTSNLFGSGNLRSVFTNDQIVAFNDLIDVEVWYARVRAIDRSNNFSAWSAIAGPTTAGGVIDAMIVADLSAAKITAGFLSASRIQTNTLTADKLASGTLTAQWIQIAGSGALSCGSGTPFTGVFMSATGLRLYKAGVEKVILDATTGDATFTGYVDAGYITSSAFNWGNGVLDSQGLRVFSSNLSSFNTNRAVSFIKAVANYDVCWSIWSPNYSELHIDRVNRGLAGTGSLADIYLGGRGIHIGWDPVAGTEVAKATWGSSTMTFNVYGEFYASYKDFIIDHPDDPEHKFLLHGVLEGPEHGVFYRGRATMKNGKAVITLPSYFDSLTNEAEATVQITPIYSGANQPASLEAMPVKAGKFEVYDTSGGPKKDRSFYWTVFAERCGPDDRPFEAEMGKADLADAVQYLADLADEDPNAFAKPVTPPPLETVGSAFSRQ